MCCLALFLKPASFLINFHEHKYFYFIVSAFTEETVCVGLARIGADTQQIVAATLQEMTSVDLGGPLHSLVVPGHMHPLEMDMLKLFAYSEHVKDLLKS